MYKYCDIERLGHEENLNILDYPEDELVVEEKLDGGNGSFFLDLDNSIHYCSRNRDLTAEKDNDKTFIEQRRWLEKKLIGKKLNSELVYYGEWMQKHTINYGTEIDKFVLFDVKTKDGAFGKPPLFLSRKAKERIAEELDLPLIKLLWTGKVKEFKTLSMEDMLKGSAYYDGDKEGIVIKSYARTNIWGRQLFAKIVNEKFKEVNHAKFGTLIKQDNSDTQKIVDTFFTPARIEKNINKLVNEFNVPLDRRLMQKLPLMVIEDVFKEETREVMRFNTLNLGFLKKKVAERCLKIIDAKTNPIKLILGEKIEQQWQATEKQ